MKPISIEAELDKAREAYKTYYKTNRKHLAYGNVKETLSAMLEKIAHLEHMVGGK